MKVIAMFVCMAALAIACQWEQVVYYHYEPILNDWQSGDSMVFELPALEQKGNYQLSIELRYTEAYSFCNLGLIVKSNLSDSLIWEPDTVNCFLRDEQGIACGKGISIMYQLSVPLGEYVSDGSKCSSICISHCMDTLSLNGLCDIGIKIKRQ